MPNLIYFAAMLRFQLLFMEELMASELAAERRRPAVRAFNKLLALDTYVTSDQIAQFAKRRVIESGKAMLAMSTPVTSIWDGILLLPLVGIVDSQRTQDIMEKTLSRISDSRARVFVMDISGVVTVDTAVANNFIRITQATRLMGCDCIISGISPSVARTLVELGANVGEVRTTATLRDALQLALTTIEPTVRDGKAATGRAHAEAMHR
jgi:rsbT co-antagonist protein RsbR